MGTPEFAVPSLQKLIERHHVSAVFTQPDRPKGRGNKVTMSAVKVEALKHDIPVYQPVKIKNHTESIELLRELMPDFIIVVAFGQILPKEVLDIPKKGCINLHASLLPKYRGAAPINWAVINGETKSGNTTMLMDVGLDTGDMLLKSEVEIDDSMTAGELHDRLMLDGADLLIETIEKLGKGEIVPEQQDDDISCDASMLSKDTAMIDWNLSSRDIHNLVRGLNPWPIAYTKYENDIMKIYETKVINIKTAAKPGTILKVSKEGLEVAAGDVVLLVRSIQFPGGKPLKVEEYIKGHSIKEGLVLG